MKLRDYQHALDHLVETLKASRIRLEEGDPDSEVFADDQISIRLAGGHDSPSGRPAFRWRLEISDRELRP